MVSSEEDDSKSRGRRVVDFGKRCIQVALDRELPVNEFIGGLAWSLYKFADAQDRIDDYLQRFVSVYQLYAESMEAERQQSN